MALGWFNLAKFNIELYERHERREHGDFNWIVPGKVIAFSSPSSASFDGNGCRTWTPEDYSPVFAQLGVTAVVRLNEVTYDSHRFIDKGIIHKDLNFLDGSCPSEDIVSQFIEFVENEAGAVAVHCKAGLGRTGTLIGCYAMKHYNFPAQEFIGWIRICRPGSVLGPQQHFLVEIEAKCRRMGKEYRQSKLKVQCSRSIEELETTTARIEMSPEDEFKREFGDNNQAEFLLAAKRRYSQDLEAPIAAQREPKSEKLRYRRRKSKRLSPLADCD